MDEGCSNELALGWQRSPAGAAEPLRSPYAAGASTAARRSATFGVTAEGAVVDGTVALGAETPVCCVTRGHPHGMGHRPKKGAHSMLPQRLRRPAALRGIPVVLAPTCLPLQTCLPLHKSREWLHLQRLP
jgi:hypothetical protein